MESANVLSAMLCTERTELWDTLLDDKFRLGRPIGSGATGVVLAAERISDGRVCAVKLLKREFAFAPDLARRLVREALVGRLVRHGGVASVLADGTLYDGSPYVALERVSGESLAQLLARMGTLSIPEALCIARRVASVLHAVHAAGFIHRDVKPEHIRLLRGPVDTLEVKLLDFGVCFGLHADPETKRRDEGRVFGTPGFVAPEQALGTAEIDVRADLYSLGATLFESLVGRPPIGGRNVAVALRAVIEQDSPPLRRFIAHAPEPVEGLVADLLARDPERRPSNARVLERRIGDLVHDVRAVERGLCAQLGDGSDAENLAPTVDDGSRGEALLGRAG